MNRIEVLAQRLRERLSDVKITLDAPAHSDGVWWLDAGVADRSITLEWRPSRGFGLSSLPTEGYGEGPDEIYRDMEDALERAIGLLRDGGKTVRPTEAGLRELRELRRVSQDQLASALGMRQAAVSKIESRADVDVTLLRKIVEALGGELEIHAKFPGYAVRLRTS